MIPQSQVNNKPWDNWDHQEIFQWSNKRTPQIGGQQLSKNFQLQCNIYLGCWKWEYSFIKKIWQKSHGVWCRRADRGIQWALIIPKSLSARIDFHFLRLCNGSCNTADPESRYLVISLHGSRRDELKIARHWPWTCQKSEKWQWGFSVVLVQRRSHAVLCWVHC